MSRTGLVILATVAVLLAGAEGCARTMGFGHPLLYVASPAGYELAPGQTVFRGNKTTHINALGARGPDIAPQPAGNVPRILVLGDSVANGGVQVDDAQTWPALLQKRRMETPGKPAEVVNASAGGWAVENEAAWLREHGTLGAKLIVLEVNEKDLDQPFVGAAILDANPSFPSKEPPFALYEVVHRYLLPRLKLSAAAADPGSGRGAFHAQNVPATLAAVEAIRATAEAHGAKLMLLYWDLKNPPNVSAAPSVNRLLAYASANRIPIVRADLAHQDGGSRFFRDDVHPNADGNAALADMLSSAIGPL